VGSRAGMGRYVALLRGINVGGHRKLAMKRAVALFVYYARGAGKTKLTNDYLEKQLGVVSTMRNWRTVGRLMSMVTGRTEHA